MKALVIGATGATGKDLVSMLLEDDLFTRVDIFVRRKVETTHPKLNVHVVDFDHIDEWKDLLRGDVLFSMMGTTLKQAGSKEAQWRIDHDYQYEAAKAASANGVGTMELMSAMTADSKSTIFYSRMKGVLEENVLSLPFKRIIITRPPSLIRKGTDRLSEKLSLKVLRILNALGLFKGMEPISTDVVAQAMVRTSKDSISGTRFLETKDIKQSI